MNTLALMFATVSTVFNITPGVLSAVCYVESNHNVKAINPNDRGESSLGLCQIKHSTARDLGFKGTRKELMDPFVNIYYAGQYLHNQTKRYGSLRNGITAYNIGHYKPGAKKYYNKVLKAYKEGR